MSEKTDKLPLDEAVAAQVGGALKLEGFFPELTAAQLEKLFPRSGLYAYPADRHLVEQDEPGRDLFVVCSGSVAIFKTFGHAGACLATLGPGDLLGEIAMVRDGVRTATAVAAEDSKVYRLSFEDIQYVLKNNPELVAHLNSLASRRLGVY